MRSVLLSTLISSVALANASGAIGYSGAPGTGSCNDCHSGGTAPSVSFTGPDMLAAGATGSYSVTVSGGTRVGVNIAVAEMLAALNPAGGNLGFAFKELYHASPQTSPATFNFTLTAPPIAGPMTIYASGNAVNLNGATSGDKSANATKVVTIMASPGSPLDPVISTPAAAGQTPLRAKSTQVTVSASDDGGPSQLSYTWSATGPGAVIFSPNSTNASSASTATFSRAGDYMITVTVRDGAGHTKPSTFALTVESTMIGINLTPYAVHLAPSATQTFTASAVDQFGAPVTPQPTITYEVVAMSGGVFGTNCTTACTSNVFKAQASSGGPFVVGARSMGIVTSATVAIGATMLPASSDNTPPTVSLLEPESGLPLTEGEIFEAIAQDPMPNPSGVQSVTFSIAEVDVGTVTASPWRLSYVKKPGLPGGKQALVARAKDLAGNETKSSSVIVDVPATSGTGGGAGGGAGGAGGGGMISDPGGGCACGTTDGSLVAAGLLMLIAALRKRVPSPLAGRGTG